ncbi:Transcriptional regulatory protein, C terminal [Serratia marcescens]|uniref:winged helix-turn-helix domain-containing protein n=1 Tax=Serratia marcescens TaxID=615 RepID=UPI0021793787|nr:winged helix-turn-helix domain-containing protein [Serratia marcescens]CAI1136960.1 Transcriptional regulatory protein, C terminal [Serratia marcescens]CAI1146438.1 Transcriptional regulatory protein, C terminal [Serratia marcescens]CAI1941115.1 Transcriptional regulatory protein, C terminal [Serratia marcescens]CAI1999507.1 Transcriptional regulatory protein, C terminal [Serratia marcescens]
MSNKIILNQYIVYDKSAASLSPVDSPDDVIFLTTPANNCLQILLNNRSEITTQKQLFAEVWEKHGIPINANTLYQNIAMIRKAFRQLGVEDDIIITVPRRGMLVAENVRIDDFSFEEPPPSELSHSMDPAHQVVSKMFMEEQSDRITTHAEVPHRKVMRRLLTRALYLLLIAASAIITSYLYREYLNAQSRFYSYRYLSDYEQCQIYIDSRDENKTKKIIETSIAKAGIRCEDHERIYASFFPGAPRESFILCDGDILKSSTQCRSYYQVFSEG